MFFFYPPHFQMLRLASPTPILFEQSPISEDFRLRVYPLIADFREISFTLVMIFFSGKVSALTAIRNLRCL